MSKCLQFLRRRPGKRGLLTEEVARQWSIRTLDVHFQMPQPYPLAIGRAHSKRPVVSDTDVPVQHPFKFFICQVMQDTYGGHQDLGV